jgi:ribosomal protein S18 acetylase RimI-like enzyme
MNSIGRNSSNNNVEKTFSGENLYHKKKINDSVDNNKNTGIPTGYKLKNSNTNVTNKENEKIPSPKHKEKLIRISEYRIEQAVDNNKNENKNSINNNIDLINRLKNQSCSLKSSITNKNQNNLSKNKAINHIFANKEILSINKHLTKEQLLRGMNILSKHDTFEICQKKFMIADKNKFNKNACIFKEKHNNSNNMGKNKNKNQNDILFKIKNLKTFHPNKNNNNIKSIKQTKDNIENKEPKNKDIENKENIVNNEIISNDKNKKDEKNELFVCGAIVGNINKKESKKQGYIAMLAVEEEYRKRGLGKKMVELLIDIYKNIYKVDEISIETEFDNYAALNLYESFGFVRTKMYLNYYFNANNAYKLKLFNDKFIDEPIESLD